jgi:arsenite-transporting ATPase
VGGKGGVGKTTWAAAWALDAAVGGARTLLLSTDPAQSLGDALEIRLSARPRRVALRRGTLLAVELDADRALARWLASRRDALAGILLHGTYFDREDVDRLLALALPGVDELVGLLEVVRLGEAGRYDRVVVDTAPTGHTLRLLATPDLLGRLAAVLDRMQEKHRFLARRLGGRAVPDAGDALIGELQDAAAGLSALLRDRDRTAVAWITAPEPMAVEETLDALAALEASGIDVRDVLVNRVTPAPDTPCRRCEARRRFESLAVADLAARSARRRIAFAPEASREPRGVRMLRALARDQRLESGLPPPSRRARASWLPASWLPASAGRGARASWLPASAGRTAPRRLRLLLFGGKGGVGKTTCAAAAAVALARRDPRRRVLLLSTDPAHSLADVLGQAVGDRGAAVAGAPATLRARELDSARAFAARRERYRETVDRLFDALRQGSAFDAAHDRRVVRDLLDLAPPGIDEIFAMLEAIALLDLDRARRSGRGGSRWDLLVMDTAPTGHALRLLELPAAAHEWTRALMAILLKYRELIGLGDMGAELLELSRGIRRLRALLADEHQTQFVAVTRPAALPAAETARLLDALARLAISCRRLVVNAVRHGRCAACRRAETAERRWLDRLATARACGARGGCAIIVAPEIVPPPRGARELARWAATWRRRRTARRGLET